ncbi:metallophosphoesterase [Jeotgalibacillus sp. R-1-5s-1]|uniref:metallophosphoesterase n=1 Tax=Jeotgalibacillus sp. R-1-5s-1 TaxID=2555897 RepID=UPI00141AF6D5|nr:metallophosphoesterase [Jeotgalibacillus sp. R-1-5s-1]
MKYLVWAAAFIAGLAAYMTKKAFENNLIHHDIQLKDMPLERPVRVLFISDLHRRKIPLRWAQSLPEADIVFIGGDMTEKGVPWSFVEHNARILSQLAPCYFVYGNNDEEVDKTRLTNILEAYGITVLENKAVLYRNAYSEGIWIAGIGDITYRKDNVDATLRPTEGGPVILLSHDPRVVNKLNPSVHGPVNLILSGHTHGGQVRIFGKGPYEKGGLFPIQSGHHLISNGYGTSFLPIRLGADPEVHFISIT